MSSDEFRSLEQLLNDAFPERFAKSKGKELDFALHWIFNLLEVCISRCAIRNEPFDSRSEAIHETIAELITGLMESDTEVVVCRVVLNLSTENVETFSMCGVEIIPDVDPRSEIPKILPRGSSVFNRDPPFVHDPPASLVVTRGRGSDTYKTGSELSDRLDTFLLSVRLLYGTTAWSAYEVCGQTSEIHPAKPHIVVWDRRFSMVRRTLKLSKDHEFSISKMGAILADVHAWSDDSIFTSFELALSRFSESYRTDQWHLQIIELTTAMEAAVSGSATTDVVLRVKSRAAALLAGDADLAKDVFSDIGIIYDLRSKLIHGGSLKRSKFAKSIRSVSTVPEGAPIGVAIAFMIDRLRDLVRRLILARIFLAEGSEPLWSLSDDNHVDASLADGSLRARFRDTWREGLENIGAVGSAFPSTAALDFLSREDRQ